MKNTQNNRHGRKKSFAATKRISYPETPEVAHTLRVMRKTMKSIEGRTFEEKMAFINNISVTPSHTKPIML